ncbi:MAG: hypothetical protein WKF87_12700 [Chryseolinea sp.]
MKDPLEDFVRRNRAGFDDKEAPASAWKNIEKSMGFNQRSLWNSLALWRAAAIIFMAVSGYLLLSGTQTKLANFAASDIASNEFKDTEEFYFKQISDKVAMIGEFQRNEGLNGFTHDFQQLDAMYLVLKEEMKSSPSEKVKDALVLNLLIRVDLLNQQLHHLEKAQGVDKKKAADRSV